MKRILTALFALGFIAVAAEAAIIVKVDGQTLRYTSEVEIDATEDTEVTYNGVVFQIPKGSKLTFKEVTVNGQKQLEVAGSNINGLQIGGNTISSNGPVAFVVSPSTLGYQVVSGNLNITDPSGRTSSYAQGQTVAPAAPAASSSSAAPAAPVVIESNSYDQTAQDVVYTEELSPSAPRP